AYQPPGSGMGGFLAGAGKIALGVGGGILVADAAAGLARGLFGDHDPGFGGFDPDDPPRGGRYQQNNHGDPGGDARHRGGAFPQDDYNDRSGGFDPGEDGGFDSGGDS